MAKKNLTDPPEITYAKFELRENLRLFFWLTFKLSMSLYKSNQCMSLQAEAKIFYENLNFKLPLYMIKFAISIFDIFIRSWSFLALQFA